MSYINIHLPKDFSGHMAFGFVSTDSIVFEKPEKNWVVFNNVMNIIGYVLSPLIGLIRIVVNAYFLFKNENVVGGDWEEGERTYLWAQIGRGALELIGGGISSG